MLPRLTPVSGLFGVVFIIWAVSVSAQENWDSQIAARIGFSSQIIYEDFMLYDIFLSSPFPSDSDEPFKSPLNTRLNFTLGILSAAGEKGILTTFGPAFVWEVMDNRLALTGGVSAAYVNPHEYGNAHIGGPLQFLSHVAVELKVIDRLGFGYYFQHLSNANIYFHNPGMNLNSFCLSCHF